MTRWILTIATLILIWSSSSFAQGGFTVAWSYFDTPLTTTCGGSTPLADGTPVKIYWDSDSNGVDNSDPLAPLCDVPPECETGPTGTCNMNQFPVNGGEYGLPGNFDMRPFVSVGLVPTPGRYYLVIFQPDGITRLWTSPVYTLISGFQEYAIARSDWTCGSALPMCVVRDEHE